MAGLNFTATMQTQDFDKGVKRIEEGLAGVGNTAKGLLQDLSGLGGAFGGAMLVRQIVSVRGEIQQLEVAFKTLLGSEEKATELMGQLTEFAATTPFELKGVSQAAKQLLAYGIAADEVKDTLTRLGDVASGLSIPLGDIVYLYGTTMTQGRMYAQDLRQFMGRGIPLVEELAKQFGVAKDEVAGLVSAGKVGAEEVKAAIVSMTSEGSKFGGMMEEQSKTITGQISNIRDSFDMMFNDIGQSSEGVINAALDGVSYLIEHYKEVGNILGGLVVAYGSYKAALIAVTAVSQTKIALERKALDMEYALLGNELKQIAAKKANATATERNTLAERENEIIRRRNAIATRQDATAKTLDTIATARNTKAVKGATVAQKGLNKVMLTNPYVLAAAAVAALAVGVYKLATADTAAEKAQKTLNKAVEDYKTQAEEKRARIDELISTIQDESSTTYDQIRAYNELKDLSPELTKQYSREEIATLALSEARKTLNEEANAEDSAFYEEKIAETEERIKQLQSEYNEALRDDDTGSRVLLTKGELTQAKALLEEYRKKYEEILKIQKQAERESKPVDVRIQLNEENIRRNNEQIDALKAKLQDLALTAEGLPADRGAEKALTTLIENYEKDNERLSAENEKLKTGGTAGTSPGKADREAAEKAAELSYKNKLLREEKALNDKRTAEDRAFALEEERIGNLTDGVEKEREEKALAHLKRLNELEREREDAKQKLREEDIKLWLTEGADRKEYQYRDRLTNDDYSDINAYYDSLKDLEEESYRKGLRLSLEEALKDIEDFCQKRVKIEKEYNEKRKTLYEADGRTLREGVSEENIRNLNRNYREAVEEAAVEEASKSRDYTAYVNGLEAMTLEELRQAAQSLGALLTRNTTTGLAGSGALTPEQEALVTAKLKALFDAIEDRTNGTDADGTNTLSTSNVERYKAQIDLFNDASRAFEELGDTIGGVTGEALTLVGTLSASTGSILSSIAAIKDALTSNNGGLNISDFSSGITGAVSAALKVVNAIAGVVSANKEANEDFSTAAREYAESIRDINDKLRLSSAESVFGTDSYKQFKEYAAIAEEARDAATALIGARQSADLFTQATGGGTILTSDLRSSWQKFWGSDKNRETINLTDFYNEQGELETDRLQAWYDEYADGLSDSNKELIESLISEWDRYEEALDEMDSYLSDLFSDAAGTIADEMVDAFIATGDAAADLTDNIDDFAQSLGKSIVKSYLLESVFSDDFKEQMSRLIQAGDAAGAIDLYNDTLSGINTDALTEVLEGMGAGSWGTSESASASSGGYTTMSEDTASELNGRFTDIQLKVNQITQLLSANLAGGGLLTAATGTRSDVALIRDDVAMIAKYTRNLEEMAKDLSKIAKNTKNI